MGARQVLRVVVAIAAISGVAHAQPRGKLAVTHDEDLVLVDLRAPDAKDRDATRAALADELDKLQGIHVMRGGGLDLALAGGGGGDSADAAAALDAAKTAYGALDCKTARASAERAAVLYAGRLASGEPDEGSARAAWAYVMLCADRDGDHAGAAVAASMLRALGVKDGGDAGIGVDTWAKYPDVDARTASLVELTVKADAGADVYVDLKKVGPAPATIVVAQGDHVIAAAAGARRAAERVTIAKAVAVELALVDQSAGAWSDVAAKVRAWRRAAPSPAELASLMQPLHVRFAFVLQSGGTLDVWVMGPDDKVARRIENASIDDAGALGSIVRDRVSAWDGRAPDPDRPLLVEDPNARGAGKVKADDHWWVYASLIGAVVLGGVVVYAHDSATDHQRVELRFP